jgi:hypothetical protein
MKFVFGRSSHPVIAKLMLSGILPPNTTDFSLDLQTDKVMTMTITRQVDHDTLLQIAEAFNEAMETLG